LISAIIPGVKSYKLMTNLGVGSDAAIRGESKDLIVILSNRYRFVIMLDGLLSPSQLKK
jgi:hypothetical protein